MGTYWRVSNYADLSGEGGRKASARWHTAGRRVVYLAESPIGALVESLVHLNVDSEDIPDFYTLLKISVPDELVIQPLQPPTGADWKLDIELTRDIGDQWLASFETPLARVPSVIAPQTWNFLLNPGHPDAGKVLMSEIIRDSFDNRLFRFGT